MKITGVESVAINVPIHADKATVGARGMHASSPFLILQVHTDEGLTGLGEVSCTPLWSGEDQDSAAHFVHTLLEPELVGQDPRELTTLSHRMHKVLANNPFTRAGIEMALWDLMGKRAGQPLHMLLGGPVRESVRTKYSVSGLEPVAAAAIASWAVEQGFTSMKVKVGMDLDTDLRRVREVRRVVGPEVLLGVDANGGWDPSTALRALPHLEDMNIAFIEQPVQSGNPRGLARIRAAAKVPIVADESLATCHDALSLVVHDAADVFSIYVGMGGGIREAVTIAAIAEAAWTPCTIGSNLELGIAQAAMIHLAVSQPAIRPDIVPCDIISRHFYEQDIVQEPLPVASGVAHRIDKPGLGIELDMTAIERFRVA